MIEEHQVLSWELSNISSLQKLALFEDEDFPSQLFGGYTGYTRYHRIMSTQPPHHGGSPRQLHSYHRGASCQCLYPRRRTWPTQGVMETRALVSYLWLTNHICSSYAPCQQQSTTVNTNIIYFSIFSLNFSIALAKDFSKNKRSRTYFWSQSFMSHTTRQGNSVDVRHLAIHFAILYT